MAGPVCKCCAHLHVAALHGQLKDVAQLHCPTVCGIVHQQQGHDKRQHAALQQQVLQVWAAAHVTDCLQRSVHSSWDALQLARSHDVADQDWPVQQLCVRY